MAKNKKIRTKIMLIFAAIVLLLAFLFMPVPYYLEMPGSAESISAYIKIDGKKDKQKGKYMLVYVSICQASPASFLASFFMPFTDRLSKSELLGDSNAKEYDMVQQYYMDDAVNEAQYVALKKAGKQVSRKYVGMYVMSVAKNSNFKNKLQIGDVVTAIDGKHYNSSQEFIKLISKYRSGKEITVTYLHNGKPKRAKGQTIMLDSVHRAGIGITLADRTEVSSPIKVSADMKGIGGPSAGLMMTLAIYQQVTGLNLRQGQKIAGTGTMNADGSVGDIGGIDKKVVSSSKAGAKIFFAPNNPVSKAEKEYDKNAKTNYQEAVAAAKKIKTKMKIVPVRTFDDAVRYLEKNKIN